MFDETLRELRRLERGLQISVSIPTDSEGYLDRECPSSVCGFQFKVCDEDWDNIVRDEEVFCPFCCYVANSDQWLTQEQLDYIQEVGAVALERRIARSLKSDATRWNRRQSKNDFIRITMKVDSRPIPFWVPPNVAKHMRIKISCQQCGCRYAVIGAAFFCPACGHNSAELMFAQSLDVIRKSLDGLSAVYSSISDRDNAENLSRSLKEYGLLQLVMAFQCYVEALYGRIPDTPKPRRNAFQNISEGNLLWYTATDKKYEDYLEDSELAMLIRIFQQRHLLAHNQGLVDQDYINRSGDTRYQPGQRLVIHKSAVRKGIEIVDKLVKGMERDTL